MSSSNGTPDNVDNLLIQALFGRLQIRPPNSPFLSQALDVSGSGLRSDDNDGEGEDSGHNQTELTGEEDRLEKELTRIILSGRSDSLKPNSGQAVTINDHHICVGYHEDEESDYRIWEWHGHIMLFDEENGYSPEYIYGNYFERLPVKLLNGRKEKEMKKGKVKKKEVKEGEEGQMTENLGLRELIDRGDSARGRILHRNINASSPRLMR